VAQKFTVPITVKQLASAGSDAVTVYVDQDTFSRLKVEAGGRLTWGSGASAGDVNLYRASADVLQTDDTFKTPVLFVDNIEIDPTGATTDQVLKFNGTKFIASTVSSGAINLDGLTDVTITSAVDGQILVYDGTNWVNTVRPSNEPMGHENKDDSVISFNEGTRTFSIAPASTSYTVWCAGKRFVKTGTETVQIPDTSGLYYIYFSSSGVLSYRTSYFVWDTDAPTAYIYWNEVDNKAYFFADERHGVTLDWATHEYLHRTRGASIASGFGVANYSIDGNGSSDTHAKFDLAGGTFFDEDLQVDIVHSNAPTANTWEQILEGNAEIPVFYRTNNHWKKDTATEFAFKQGTFRPQYNLFTSPNWSTVDIANNKFAISWIIATNNLNEPVIAIMGQNEYLTIGEAEAAVWEGLNLDGFPIVEFRPLHKVVFQGTDSFTNSVNAAIRGIYDLRRVSSNGSAIPSTPVSDHGSMTGLADDDHTQYLTDARHNALDHSTAMGTVVLDDINDVTAPTPSSGDFLKWNGTAWVNDPINLGTDTVGNYVSSVTAGTGISVDFTPSEGAGASVSLNATLDNLSDVTAPTPANGEVLQWNGTAWVPSLVVGPAGPAGPAGENGMAGAAGESGAPGADGMDGADGMNGADGADGAPGEPGPPGETGATGPAGADGAGSVKYVFATNASPVASGQITFGSQVYFPFVSEIKIHVYSKNGTQNNGWIALWESGGNLLISNSAGDVAMFTLNSAPTLSSSVYTIDVTSFNTWDAAKYLELSFGFDGTTNFNEDVSIIYIPGVPAAVSGAVNTSDVGTVTSTMILDGTIVNADISTSAGIELSKLSTTGASVGNVVTYNGSQWTAASAGGGGASVTVSDTPPASPTAGNLWFESDTTKTYIYYGSAWVEVGSIPTIHNLNDIGDVQAPTPTTGQVLQWNGTYWVPAVAAGGGLNTSTDGALMTMAIGA
jgi:hypothetical protein